MPSHEIPNAPIRVPQAVRDNVRWLLEKAATEPAPDMSQLSEERNGLIDQIHNKEIDPFEDL